MGVFEMDAFAKGTFAVADVVAGLNAITIGFAHALGPKVRVNCIVAGPFLTDIAKAWTPESRETANNALGRPGRPEEIVGAALFLASPASTFTTGALVRVEIRDTGAEDRLMAFAVATARD